MPVTDIQDSHREIFERSLAAEVEDNSTIPHKSYEDRITQDPPKGLYPPGIPEEGWGSGTLVHIADDLLPVLSGQARSSRYYGFVTGGSLPMAQLAEQAVVAMDQNVMVHMPRHSVTTIVEDVALKGVLDLLNMDTKVFPGRTFTTGATGSNILGLACGREGVLEKRGASVSDLGLLGACMKASVTQIRILASGAHSTISKAASIVGIGRSNIVDVSYSTAEPWRLDINRVERELQVPGAAHIISVSAGEVNTGRFATTGLADMKRLRTLADKHNAWIHVDGAFGIFARHLPNTPEFQAVKRGVEGLELADSITADGHKCLNVPYDTGIFFSRHLDLQTRVCTNGFAAYLSGGAKGIPSPMNVGLENSRRWRALPVYTVLWSEGKRGMQEMFVNMVRMARALVEFIRSSEHYILMPDEVQKVEDTHIIVLFRAKDTSLNEVLVDRINETRDMFVSGTKWNGHTACRVAVSNWKVDVEKDIAVVSDILNKIAREHRNG